ncbi:unnamed protein product [Arctogadus glacialis]
MGRYFNPSTFLRLPLRHSPFQHRVSGQVQFYERRECSEYAFILRGFSGNAPKIFTMVRKIHSENDHTSEDPSLSGNEAQDSYIQTPVGLLCIDEESPQLNPSKVGIVLEGSLVMDDLASLPQAFCILFGLIYTLHLDYPKYMKNIFSFVQQ